MTDNAGKISCIFYIFLEMQELWNFCCFFFILYIISVFSIFIG